MTDCKGCIFLKDNKCYLGRHEKWEPDENLVIKHSCNAKRKESWLGCKDLEQAEIQVRSEILYKTHVFIYCPNWSFSKIKRTLSSLENQLLPPLGISLIGTKKSFKESFYKRFGKRCDIVVCIDDNYDRYNCLDASINRCKAPFYILIQEGFSLPEHFLANIDSEINQKLEKFSYIENNYEGFIYGCSLILHKALGGNMAGYFRAGDNDKEILFATNDIEPKVKYLCSLDNSWSYIRKYENFTYVD